MTDIVERLRGEWPTPGTCVLLDEAADDIERLRGLLTRMLQWDQFNPPMTGDHASWKRQIEAALAGAADQPPAATDSPPAPTPSGTPRA